MSNGRGNLEPIYNVLFFRKLCRIFNPDFHFIQIILDPPSAKDDSRLRCLANMLADNVLPVSSLRVTRFA